MMAGGEEDLSLDLMLTDKRGQPREVHLLDVQIEATSGIARHLRQH